MAGDTCKHRVLQLHVCQEQVTVWPVDSVQRGMGAGKDRRTVWLLAYGSHFDPVYFNLSRGRESKQQMCKVRECDKPYKVVVCPWMGTGNS